MVYNKSDVFIKEHENQQMNINKYWLSSFLLLTAILVNIIYFTGMCYVDMLHFSEIILELTTYSISL